ncbi:otoconin-90 [Dromiciops gliroides]|uniref:otoconin-90 n=1 Tax=Dromiciops gliroides TaxID=33562 RepID=UPI001CC5D37D|nr:otoconin-90 [Dromiciops gliroides]
MKMMLAFIFMSMLMLPIAGGQEGDTPDLPSEITQGLPRNINNITFFNGAFKDVESVTLFFDCLGSHFTWLQAIFTNFPALIHFVNKLKCAAGLCPKDFEDYGCSCRFEMEGEPIDETDSCCFQHRKCYEDADELECTRDLTKLSMDVTCDNQIITCESKDPCEHLLCNCDKTAIECFLHSHINSSLNGLDIAFCMSTVTDTNSKEEIMTLPTDLIPEVPTESSLEDSSVEAAVRGHEGTIRPETIALLGFQQPVSTTKGVMNPLSSLKSGESEVQALELIPKETRGKDCDRFTFVQLGDSGEVKQEMPQIGEMLFCLTAQCPEDFESYGCYCGQEGRGDPVDPLDRCCFSHHCCLEQAKKFGCGLERSSRSKVTCEDHKPKCRGQSLCENLLCSCDQTAAECMAAATFNESVRFWSRSRCQENGTLCEDSNHEWPLAPNDLGSRSSSSEENSSEESVASHVGSFRRKKRFLGKPFGHAGSKCDGKIEKIKKVL